MTMNKVIDSAFGVAFSARGWQERYLAYRSRHPLSLAALEGAQAEQGLHDLLLPTGILHGFPIAAPFPLPGAETRRLPRQELLHFAFLDSLLALLALDLAQEGHGTVQYWLEQPAALFAQAKACIQQSRLLETLALHRRLASPQTWFSQRARFQQRIARLLLRAGLQALPGEFQNSLLLLDVHAIRQWRTLAQGTRENLASMRAALFSTQINLRRTLLMLMVAAAHASGATSEYETRLIRHFIASSRLPRTYRQEAAATLAQGAELPQIPPLTTETPWLLRRFFLNATLMTLLENGVFAPRDHAFTQSLKTRLALSDADLESSLTLIPAFFASHHKRFAALNGKAGLVNLADGLRLRTQTLVKKNLRRIIVEIEETRELKALLLQATRRSLTPEEKQKVRAQLLDILKTIPSLAIFALPGGGILLPVLLQVLPFNLLPSTFQQVVEED